MVGLLLFHRTLFFQYKGAALGGLSDLRDPERDILQPLFVADSRDAPGGRGSGAEPAAACLVIRRRQSPKTVSKVPSALAIRTCDTRWQALPALGKVKIKGRCKHFRANSTNINQGRHERQTVVSGAPHTSAPDWRDSTFRKKQTKKKTPTFPLWFSSLTL